MKITLYQLSYDKKNERFDKAIDFYKRMKELHRLTITFTPMVLVEDIPNETKPKWLKLNELKKLEKQKNNP